jgi:hypothetical protein
MHHLKAHLAPNELLGAGWTFEYSVGMHPSYERYYVFPSMQYGLPEDFCYPLFGFIWPEGQIAGSLALSYWQAKQMLQKHVDSMCLQLTMREPLLSWADRDIFCSGSSARIHMHFPSSAMMFYFYLFPVGATRSL